MLFQVNEYSVKLPFTSIWKPFLFSNSFCSCIDYCVDHVWNASGWLCQIYCLVRRQWSVELATETWSKLRQWHKHAVNRSTLLLLWAPHFIMYISGVVMDHIPYIVGVITYINARSCYGFLIVFSSKVVMSVSINLKIFQSDYQVTYFASLWAVKNDDLV